MSFQFIENGKIDGAARKLIRSHVMKGKNVLGTARPRRTRKCDGAVLYSRESLSANAPIQTYLSPNSGERDDFSVPRPVGNSLSSVKFPYELQPYMRELIFQFAHMSGNAVYPSEFCLPISAGVKFGWFHYLQSDEAFFHSFLVMSEIFVDGKTETTPQALRHLSNTYRCIKQNLDKDPSPSDSTVAAVMSLAIHEDLRCQPHRSKVHVDALERIVSLRGGIAQLKDNKLLLQKICRADIQYALCIGSSPRFYRDEFPRELIQGLFSKSISRENLIISESVTEFCDLQIREVLVDMMTVSAFFNDDRAFVKLDPWEYQEILISMYYRLLHRYPLTDTGPENDHDNSCYLGLLALMTTLFFNYGSSRRLPYDLLAAKLRNAIERAFCNTTFDESKILWLLFVGGISVFDTTDQAWLNRQLSELLSKLNIDSWQIARAKLKSLPWIDAAHDKLGQNLWQAVYQTGPY